MLRYLVALVLAYVVWCHELNHDIQYWYDYILFPIAVSLLLGLLRWLFREV